MTRVDFYVLEDDAEQAREHFACRLVEKAFRLKHTVYLHAASPAEARRLDGLLWTWSDRSFLPHVLAGPDLHADLAAATPVQIGAGNEPGFEAELMVNLDVAVPLFFSRFDRVAEIVGGSEGERTLARERFRFYRDRGYALETHRIGSPAR